jgi:hypothetical protein
MNPRSLLLPALGLLCANGLMAAVFLNSETLSSGNNIDDPPSAGLSRTLSISTAVTTIAALTITLDIGSAVSDTAWNGDLYVQLISPHGTVAVLVDRAGLSPTDTTTGYGDAGYNVSITDATVNDVHTYQSVAYTLNGSNQLTGTWQSDGRVDPTTSSRTKNLNTIFGENPNGTWTLLVVDQASGSLAKLNGWGISGSDIAAVPEPLSTALCSSLALLALASARRLRRG